MLFFIFTKRGFASEVLAFINACEYAKSNNLKLYYNSTFWNSNKKNGWVDYFESNNLICEKEFNVFININEFVRNPYTYLKYLLSFKLYFNLDFISFIKYLKFSKSKKLNVVCGNVGVEFNKKSNRLWNILTNERNLFHYSQVNSNSLAELTKSLYRPNNCSFTSDEFSALYKDIKNNKYISVHIRRGDKVYGANKEAEVVKIQDYINLINKINRNNCTLFFVSSDDFNTINLFKRNNPSWRVHHLTPDHFDGHDQANFNNLSTKQIYSNTKLLIQEIFFHTNSMVHIGTASSNINKLIALNRNNKNTTFSVDEVSKKYDNYFST